MNQPSLLASTASPASSAANPFQSFVAWPWAGMAQMFPVLKMPWQGDWMNEWAKAMQAVPQGGALGGTPNSITQVLHFAPEKLREVQDSYMKEAAEL